MQVVEIGKRINLHWFNNSGGFKFDIFLLPIFNELRVTGESCNFCCCKYYPGSQNLRRGIVTLKVKRNSPGAPSLSTFTTPRSTPGSSRRNSKDVTADSSSSNNSSPTMFRKLRQKRSQKEKTAEVVLYKGVICKLIYVFITNNIAILLLWIYFDLTSTKIVIVFDFVVS